MDFDKDIVKEGYNQIAAAYFLEAKQDADGVLAHYVSKLLELLKECPPEGSEGRTPLVLDIGCGAKLPADALLVEASAQVLGCDISEAQIALARANVPEATYECVDIMDFQVENSSIDAAIALFSVFHLPRQEQTELFQRVQRWLRPGGVFIFNIGSEMESEIDETDDFLGANMLWSSWGLRGTRARLEDAKFIVGKVESFTVQSTNTVDNTGQRFIFFIGRCTPDDSCTNREY